MIMGMVVSVWFIVCMIMGMIVVMTMIVRMIVCMIMDMIVYVCCSFVMAVSTMTQTHEYNAR